MHLFTAGDRKGSLEDICKNYSEGLRRTLVGSYEILTLHSDIVLVHSTEERNAFVCWVRKINERSKLVVLFSHHEESITCVSFYHFEYLLMGQENIAWSMQVVDSYYFMIMFFYVPQHCTVIIKLLLSHFFVTIGASGMTWFFCEYVYSCWQFTWEDNQCEIKQ